MAKYVMSLDQGTTSTRAILYDEEGREVDTARRKHRQIYPQPSWVEHDPLEIWGNCRTVMREVLEQKQLHPDEVVAIGITNQRETAVVWEKVTGKPIYNAIVWQDRRTASTVDALVAEGLQEEVSGLSGLVLDAYFSSTKIAWILDSVPGARARAEAGELLFGTIDTWLTWKLSGGKTHVTDYSNASRTGLLNIKTLKWDERLLKIFRIPEAMLPSLVSSSGVVGETKDDIFGKPVPISGIAGDQQAATFGHANFDTGVVKNTYGTGCFLVLPTGDKIYHSQHKLLSTVAWSMKESTCYALEGSIFTSGSAVNWVRDRLELFKDTSRLDEICNGVANNGGIFFVPALNGLGAPHWDSYARGAFFGISPSSTKSHFVRASLEGVAYQVYDVVKCLEKDTGSPVTSLKVDGGLSQSDFLMQFQSDLLGVPVERPDEIERTARGAAYLAGLGTGFWSGIDELKELASSSKTFVPDMKESTRTELLEKWSSAVERVSGWEACGNE